HRRVPVAIDLARAERPRVHGHLQQLIARAAQRLRLDGRQRLRQRSKRRHMRVAGMLAPLAPSTAPAGPPLQPVFDSSPLPMCICDAVTRRLLAVNDAALCLYGWSRDELLARRLDDIEADAPAPLTAPLRQYRTAKGAVLQLEVSEQPLDYAG